MKYLAMTSVVAIISACATIEPVCDPKMARAVTNSSGAVLYTPTPTTPTPTTPDRPKGDASLNSGEDRTGRGDNGKGQGKNRP